MHDKYNIFAYDVETPIVADLAWVDELPNSCQVQYAQTVHAPPLRCSYRA